MQAKNRSIPVSTVRIVTGPVAVITERSGLPENFLQGFGLSPMRRPGSHDHGAFKIVSVG
jgi:hypothetical protein